MGKSVKKIIGTVGPIAASFIPGIGLPLAAAIGAGGGLLSGGGLRGALLGAVSSGLGASGIANSVGSSISNGIGLGGVGASTIGHALQGAAQGAAGGGGLRGALLGAATGGLGANAGDITNSVFGTPASTPLAAGVQGPSTAGTEGLLGTHGQVLGGGTSSFANVVPDAISALGASNTADDNERLLAEAQGRSEAALSPYSQAGADAANSLQSRLSTGFQPGDLTQDPGYQFRLGQGTDAINRSLGAQGNLFSGRALTAAQDYGQGLADSTYQDAYNRWSQENQQLASQSGQGINAANSLTGVYDNQGNIGANNNTAQNNILSSSLSNLLGGGTRRIVGYKPDGTPIYDTAG